LYGQFWWGVNFGTPSYHVWQANSNAITSVALSGLNFIGVSNWGNAAGGVIAVSEFSLSQL
jgi:hypothetical protein